MSKDKKPERITSLAELGKLAGVTPAGARAVEGRPAPTAKSSAAGAGVAAKPQLHSVRVKQRERAGRAPYNFVPLADEVKYLTPAEAPPGHDTYTKGLLSGVIEVELQALTDFYVRGMWPLEQYRGEGTEQTFPFLVDGELRIPGSSLRGMIRTLLEIVSRAPLDPINDEQLFFRAVAASEHLNPHEPNSFEPQALAYKSRMIRADLQTDANGCRILAGYLYGGRDEWYIQPALAVAGRQWYRYRTEAKWLPHAHVTFTPGAPPWADVMEKGGTYKGWTIVSGHMPGKDGGKKSQWVIHEEDARPEGRLMIPEVDVRAYREGGVTPKTRNSHFEYSAKSKGVPCFFVEWKDADGERRVSFGHTHYFRLPYSNSTAKGIPVTHRRDPEKWDLAQALFGRVPQRRLGAQTMAGRRSRVQVEDAVLVSAPTPAFGERESIVLGQPKPTTYQHYLVQPGEGVDASVHWDGNKEGVGEPVVRGHKLYWHRPGIALRKAGQGQDNVASTIRPAKKDAKFRAALRFENLREWELGALLMVLSLPEGCAHHLGLGKPLGLGSFRLRLAAIREIDRTARYRGFAQGDRLVTGESRWTAEQLTGAMNAFAAWLTGDAAATAGKLWQEPRMRDLWALLRLDGLPADWEGRTRYLEFGKVMTAQGREVDYNEYLRVGYPGRLDLQKRRPLPPAMQVWEDRGLPSDPRPEFLPPRRGRG